MKIPPEKISLYILTVNINSRKLESVEGKIMLISYFSSVFYKVIQTVTMSHLKLFLLRNSVRFGSVCLALGINEWILSPEAIKISLCDENLITDAS